MQSWVIKIGGSLMYKENQLHFQFIKDAIETLKEIRQKVDGSIIVVIGGGKLARNLVEIAKQLENTNADMDELGVLASRIHANLFMRSWREGATQKIPHSFSEMTQNLSLEKVLFTGGWQPGQSTNAVAALAAEYTQSVLINLTNVDGVYDTKDIKNLEISQKPIQELSYTDFRALISMMEQKPGEYTLFDLLGATIIERSRILTYFANGQRIKSVLTELILEKKKVGTLVRE